MREKSDIKTISVFSGECPVLTIYTQFRYLDMAVEQQEIYL